MSLTLDDLRQPGFGSRLWGYDRDEVDQLLASVVVSIERLQRRRQRDGEAIERATTEAQRATERAKRAERERDELVDQIQLANQAVTEADRRAQRLVAEAERRVERAEQANRNLRGASSAWTAAGGSDSQPPAAASPLPGAEEEDFSVRLPLAVRAARVLLAEARERAAAIEAEVEHRRQAAASPPPGQSSSSGSSPTIHS